MLFFSGLVGGIYHLIAAAFVTYKNLKILVHTIFALIRHKFYFLTSTVQDAQNLLRVCLTAVYFGFIVMRTLGLPDAGTMHRDSCMAVVVWMCRSDRRHIDFLVS